MTKHVTIFADGVPCSASLRNRVRKKRFTIVLDGAAEAVRRQGWLPGLISGDFDAISKGSLRYFARKGVAVLPTPDQRFTDLEKALAWSIQQRAESIWITQALGGRTDHTFTNLALLKRYHDPRRELFLFSEGERIRFAKDGRLRLEGAKGRRMAILPFPRCRVRSSGLVYELTDTKLSLGLRESTANCAQKALVTLSIQGEALVVEGLAKGSPKFF